jgi:hypothetical protein
MGLLRYILAALFFGGSKSFFCRKIMTVLLSIGGGTGACS